MLNGLYIRFVVLWERQRASFSLFLVLGLVAVTLVADKVGGFTAACSSVVSRCFHGGCEAPL